MTKYDQHGFLTVEWATANIDGFTEFDPCCQQLQILFPDVPHECTDVVKPVEHTVGLPEYILNTPDPQGYAGGGLAKPVAAATGAAMLAGILYGRDDSSYLVIDSPPKSVPAPGSAGLLIAALVVGAISKRFYT